MVPTIRFPWSAPWILLAIALGGAFVSPASAQYFGRNKVRHETFDFEVLHTEHFDIHYYVKSEEAAREVGRMAERWYTRLSTVLDHEFIKKKPLVLYSDDTDFQQTNIISGLGQGTGGVTESFKNRVVMPLTGSYAETDHVLGHELVHVFQYDRAQRARGGRLQLGRLPLWFIEGMAEYLSVGSNDAFTAMWLRDSVLHDDLPSARDLATNYRYFPYRFGQAVWSYITGRWGDEIVMQLYDACMRMGLDPGFQKVLGKTSQELVEEWQPELKEVYLEQLEGRTHPEEMGRPVVTKETSGGDINLAPAPSPDGSTVAFLSERDLFSIDLFLADTEDGHIVRKLASANSNPHFDALRYIDSAGTWSPDGKRFAFVVFARGDNEIAIMDVKKRKIRQRIMVSEVGSLTNPAWSPDGRSIAFSGLTGSTSDVFVADVETGEIRNLTNDDHADRRPNWSPDGRTIAFMTDRGEGTELESLSFDTMGLALMDAQTGEIAEILRPFEGADHVDPSFAPNGRDLYFISNRDGFRDIYRYDLETRRAYQVTRVATGITGITPMAPALAVLADGSLMFTVFSKNEYSIHSLTAEETQGELVTELAAVSDAFVLPPHERLEEDKVLPYLEDHETGLVDGEKFHSTDYKPSLGLDYIGQTGAGLAVDRFGAVVTGGVFASFSDMLNNHTLGLALQTTGGFKDTGAQLFYQNHKRRWSWGASVSHIPFLGIRTTVTPTTVQLGEGEPVPGQIIEQSLERVFIDQGAFILHYPISRSKRVELGTSYSYYNFDVDIQRFIVVDGVIVGDDRLNGASRPGYGLTDLLVAIVHDTSIYGFSSPIMGTRYRLEMAPVFGRFEFQRALLDYRKYVFHNPSTIAFRGMHFGRYGRDAENRDLSDYYLGYPTLIRGYDIDTIDVNGCSDGGDCGLYDRLVGSRVALANLELRVQVLGVEQLGLIPFPYFPIQIAGFFDAGVAWTSQDPPFFRWEIGSRSRVPVASAGIAARTVVFGALPLEFYWAMPFHRTQRQDVFGFQITPGW